MADDKKARSWELVQIKAFTSWINSTLQQKDIKVEDLQSDLSSGVALCVFLELATQKRLPSKYDKNPSFKIQKIQNLSIALNFIQKDLSIRLVGIGAEDFVDGNLKLILGLLWSLFRKLQIAVIKHEDKSSEEGLLLWIKKMTEGYLGVEVESFRESFRDGLAFAALIHKFDPTLIDYQSLQKNNGVFNLEQAFEIAEQSLGIPKLLDPEETHSGEVDERSVILYSSLFFHAFVAAEERKRIEAEKAGMTGKLSEMESNLAEEQRRREEMQQAQEQLEEDRTRMESELAAREGHIKEMEDSVARMREEMEAEREQFLADKKKAEEEARLALGNLSEAGVRRERELMQKLGVIGSLLEQERKERAELEALHQQQLDELTDLQARERRLREQINEHMEGSEQSKEELEAKLRELEGLIDAKNAEVTDLEVNNEVNLLTVNDLRKRVKKEVTRRRQKAKAFLELEEENNKLKTRAIHEAKAQGGLDSLKTNLMEHLEDLYRWRDLYQLDEGESERVTFNLDQVLGDLKTQAFSEQVSYLNDKLQEENLNLLRILRLKDSKNILDEVIHKQGWLLMKGRKKKEGWKKHWFVLRGSSLSHYETDEDEYALGTVHLDRGCEVVRLKAVSDDKDKNSKKKLWPLKLVVEDVSLVVRCATKKERASWFLLLNSKIAHLNYLTACQDASMRPDTRIVNLFTSKKIPEVRLVNHPVTEAGLAALAHILTSHEELESVIIKDSDIGDEEAKPICQNLTKAPLKELVLSDNKLTTETAMELAKSLESNTNLTRLDLSNNKIDDIGVSVIAEMFAKNENLSQVNLAGNEIGSDGIRHFCGELIDHAIPELLFARNNIGDDGAKAIAELIKTNKSVKTIDLTSNKIGDDGVVALAEALAENDSLVRLHLGHNNVTAVGVVALKKALANNTELLTVDLSNNSAIEAEPSTMEALTAPGFHFPDLSLRRTNPE